ncbi:DUF4469 domain-containing protein [Treponema endosymbiont of Eucomonympha sp.]|nr:DUF4469 domain-containing protein [Treponema endosymbiont of Eucomonympha sp.]
MIARRLIPGSAAAVFIHVPAALAAGTYRLQVITRFSNGKTDERTAHY